MHGWRRRRRHCRNRALPAEPHFQLPAAALTGWLERDDGCRIRTLTLPVEQPRANLIVLNGRADFLEKWADAWASLAGLRCSLYSWDWRGQGASSRNCATDAGHIDSFDRWLHDVDILANQALATLGDDAPWFVLGHSMGGHLTLRWLTDPARRDHPLRRRLRGGILTAPFFGVTLARPMRTLARLLSQSRVDAGRGAEYAWTQTPYGAVQKSAAAMAILTSSRPHFEDEARWIDRNPALATGGVTWGWLNAFFQSQKKLEAGPLEEMDLPLLMLLAEGDKLISNVSAQDITTRLPDVQVQMMPGAHELLRETDDRKQAVLARIAAFLQDHGA